MRSRFEVAVEAIVDGGEEEGFVVVGRRRGGGKAISTVVMRVKVEILNSERRQ